MFCTLLAIPKLSINNQSILFYFQDGIFDGAASLLSHSFKRVQGLRRTRVMNCKFMCYFALVAAVFLLLVYFLMGRVL